MPSTWPTPRVWVASERVSASKMNELSTALGVLYPYTAGGDMAYRSTAGDYLTRLAKPTFNAFLQMSSAGTPAWGSIKNGTLYNATGSTYNSTTERDLPNSSGTITIDVISTILFIGKVFVANSSTTNCWSSFAPSIDGTVGNFSNFYYGNGIGVTIPLLGRKTGVAPGSRTIKIREKEGYGAGNTYSVGLLEWLVLSIPE